MSQRSKADNDRAANLTSCAGSIYAPRHSQKHTSTHTYAKPYSEVKGKVIVANDWEWERKDIDQKI